MIAAESKPALPDVRKIWTEEEISNLPDNGYNYEIVDGELVMSPKNNPEHSDICAEISMRMRLFAKEQKLGRVWESNVGFWMTNRNLRAPDVSFVSAARLNTVRPLRSFFQGAPDLAVEVLSPSNTRFEIDQRLRDFFESGTRLAWVIDPISESAEVCHSAIDRQMVGPGAILDGEDVLPGFQLPLAELFENWG
jgi:Uma2 family endonuclease